MVIKVASVNQLRAIEAEADRKVMSYAKMMLNAGRAASRLLQERIDLSGSTVMVLLIGKGNNGGDGLVIATDLARRGAADVRLYLLEARPADDRHLSAAAESGARVTCWEDDNDAARLTQWIREADVIVDALFGIGVRLPLQGAAASLLRCVKARLSEASRKETVEVTNPAAAPDSSSRKRPYVFAVDCPSGVDCDSGLADTHTIAADATVTFIAAKWGLLTFPAAQYVGELLVSQIGIPDELPALQALATAVVDGALAAELLPPRPLDGHKGTFGKVMIVAGSSNYIGAVALAGEAAGRSGAGLITIATTKDLVTIVSSRLREPTWLPLPAVDGAIAKESNDQVVDAAQAYDALLVGCGLGLGESTRRFVWRLCAATALPGLVIDADALNALSTTSNWWAGLPADTIITPHSGEMSRLTGLSTREINRNRWCVAQQYAEAWGLVLVLKGAHTIVAAPNGQSSVIPFKSDALGSAGTGDVLAGLIAGLRGQGLGGYDSARLGAYVHALAGTIAAQEVGSSRSVIAGDVLDALGKAFGSIERA